MKRSKRTLLLLSTFALINLTLLCEQSLHKPSTLVTSSIQSKDTLAVWQIPSYEQMLEDSKRLGSYQYKGIAHKLSITGHAGPLFPTAQVAQKAQSYASGGLSYMIQSTGDHWKDLAFNLPFYGVGVMATQFQGLVDLGVPVSMYVFSGSTIKQFTERLGLSYMWNLGLSMNWHPYDPFSNRDNDAIGSEQNVYVGFKLFLDYALSNHLDLHFGAELSHFSNGSSRQPNLGLNMGGMYMSLAYNFQRPDKSLLYRLDSRPPEMERHLDQELMFLISSRQTKFSTDGTGLPSPYVDREFKVLGITYATMIVENYRYKWGPSCELVYDESSQARAWREFNHEDQAWYDRVQAGPFWHRLQVGLSLRGEISLPHFAIFANLGYNVIHQHHSDERFYQILGLKIYLKDNFFGAFGIRAAQFSQAQYLYWNLGYTISPYKRK